MNNKWNHDIILHEAGVPPIHTFFILRGSIFFLQFYRPMQVL